MFLLFYLRSAGGTDAGEEVGTEDADSEDGNREGDNEVHEGGDNLTDLEVDASNRDLELRDTLASSGGGRQERGDDTVGKRREELGHDGAEVDGGGDDDNILRVEHFVCKVREKTDSFGYFLKSPEMENYNSIFDIFGSYRPGDIHLLQYLRSTRKFLGDDFCSDERREWSRNYQEDRFWGTYSSEVPRNDDGCILEKEALEWTKRNLDDFYAEGELAPFTRTVRRTETFKEELMMATWHPRRIQRLLELGGEEALDNFAGV